MLELQLGKLPFYRRAYAEGTTFSVATKKAKAAPPRPRAGGDTLTGARRTSEAAFVTR